uniref:Uncharacterized protein n=1 Tax=Arundo donax TaxID=35708 RepID=A0A0A9FEB2_ARUDO
MTSVKCITYCRMRKCYGSTPKMRPMTSRIKYHTGKRWRLQLQLR